MSNKRDRAVQIVPNADTRTVPYKSVEIDDASRPIGGVTEAGPLGIFDDRDVAGVPQNVEPDGDQLVAVRETSPEEALAALSIRYDILSAALQALEVERNALLTTKQAYEALAKSTVWEVAWQSGRAWVVASSIEEALDKVRKHSPGVNPNSVKAAGVTLVL